MPQLEAQLYQWFANALMIEVLTFKHDMISCHILASCSLSGLSLFTWPHIILVHKFKPQRTGSGVFD